MDANQVLEFLKIAAPALAAGGASYFACRERIRVLEVKLEAMQDAYEQLRTDLNLAFPRSLAFTDRRPSRG